VNNQLLRLISLVFPLVLVCSAARADDAQPETMLDLSRPRALQQMFGAYGPAHQRIVTRANGMSRFHFPPGRKDPSQLGLYSYFALAGDFAITVTYDLTLIPRSGQAGIWCVGVAVDEEDEGRSAEIQRTGNGSPEASGYLVTASPRDETDPTSGVREFFATNSRHGLIALRRVGSQLVFLKSDNHSGELEGVHQIPFTNKTVRQLRLFAQAETVTSWVEFRLSGLDVRANEITGGIPRSAGAGSIVLWLLGICAVIAVGVSYRWRNHFRARRD
jgi:hypothetical protein